jgi:hypothetical protein
MIAIAQQREREAAIAFFEHFKYYIPNTGPQFKGMHDHMLGWIDERYGKGEE